MKIKLQAASSLEIVLSLLGKWQQKRMINALVFHCLLVGEGFFLLFFADLSRDV